ncbi:MAG: hypothetical protein IJI06_08805 [Oscillospiraceae bacterium]|nr:hypothetical protein [Oscillospiraceae bacterium]
MNNMELYENFRSVPDWAKKQISGGRMNGKTDISPMWRIQALTEVFGPCGYGWRYEIMSQRLETAGKEIKAFVDINLYVKWGETWSEPIPGIGGNTFMDAKGYVSDECFKMALTDAISVAAKALGVGADVYMGCDQTKYTASREDNSPPPQQQTPPPPQQRRQEPAPQNPQPTTYFTCARCGRKLTPYNDSNGRPVSLRAHAEKSMQVFGEVLCLDCMPK